MIVGFLFVYPLCLVLFSFVPLGTTPLPTDHSRGCSNCNVTMVYYCIRAISYGPLGAYDFPRWVGMLCVQKAWFAVIRSTWLNAVSGAGEVCGFFAQLSYGHPCAYDYPRRANTLVGCMAWCLWGACGGA